MKEPPLLSADGADRVRTTRADMARVRLRMDRQIIEATEIRGGRKQPSATWPDSVLHQRQHHFEHDQQHDGDLQQFGTTT